MYYKKGIILYYSIILFTILSLINSNFPILSIIFAQNTNSISPSPLPPLYSQSSLSSNQIPLPPPFSDQLSPQQIASSTNKTCTLTPSLIEEEGTPQQTEGPYFVPSMPNRSNITSDPSDGTVQQGIPLHLVIHVYKINNNSSNNTNSTTTTTTAVNSSNTSTVSCLPFSGAHVDIWHANPQGLYSGIAQIGTQGKMYLRGYQSTDNNGTVKFDTIYPGWYQGRAIHIHVMVRAFNGGGANETFHWTSQMYLSNSINQQVHTQLPYSKHGPPPMTNEQDGIYTGPSTDKLIQSNTGQHLMLNLTKDKQQGYVGTFNIVVNAPSSEKK
jgi:protocatechuate 3,4-dioxygenase beta subunit